MVVRVWVAGLLITVGAVWLLDAVEVLDAGAVLSQWWPLALIALGLLSVLAERRVSLGPVVVTVVGVVLQVGRLVEVSLSVWLWPTLAILVGSWLLLTGLRRRSGDPTASESGTTVALLGGSETRSRSSHFEHADVAAVLGGATLDLRDARVAPGARVDAFALFGGVEVIVPEDTRVTLHGLPLFGGLDDKTSGNGTPVDGAPVLDVRATALFGGVEVKNKAR
ncbi:LiaF transmembrane domain-containing protein [Aquipuribacter nitratireducens]|uniref:LiaF domain-containing protein n=1 Tax=Aquipuribacter nitratireducens TaxID=650104 RepID=A0ABW0GQ35_9MICO